MARIFITGSTDGLGQLAAIALISQGHRVVLHARNVERGQQALDKVAGAETVLIADLSNIAETKALASKVNAMGKFDAVIHNAGVYQKAIGKNTSDGLPLTFAVNSLAPYILTCLIQKSERLIYLSSGMHLQGNPDMDKLTDNIRHSNNEPTYSDTKLHDLILCKAVARKWTDIYSNAVDPGWVPTKMGGRSAPDKLEEGFQTQVWLAVSDDHEVQVSGRYFHHKREANYLLASDEAAVQEKFLDLCAQVTGIPFPISHP